MVARLEAALATALASEAPPFPCIGGRDRSGCGGAQPMEYLPRHTRPDTNPAFLL